MTAPIRQPFSDLPPPQQAGILCNDPRFQKFAATRCGMNGQQFGQSAAAQYLHDACNIDSRRELTNSPKAAETFQRLRTEFDACRGKIPTPR
ncbi:MAG: hypothetical protein COB08_000705 [Rhodobacteraceae bacterium]|nr:hypothetical protein [Paracoccaceae bacterium]